jgi:hypothetical protein
MPNKRLRPVQDEGDPKGPLKNPKLQQPQIFSRLLRTVTIETLDGPKNIKALFDTGANVFILSQERVQIHNIFLME